MKIQLKAKVICKDGDFGSIKELLIDPVKGKVSHIVIENEHNSFQLIIPIELVDYTSDSVVTIDKTADELNEYPKFIIKEFMNVPASEVDFVSYTADQSITNSYTMFPYVMHDGKRVVEVTKEIIPEGEQRFKKGLAVKDPDGKALGHVDELIIDADSHCISHIVMRTGHIFGAKEVAVPKADVISFEESSVVLSIGEDDVNKLPEVVIKRAWK
jgi:sporulation protein YlmC with PRC-barrel domain